MTSARVSLLHLACGLAGWGAVTGLRPLMTEPPESAKAVQTVAPSKTTRPRLDATGGRRVIERLSRNMPPEVFNGYFQTLNGAGGILSEISNPSDPEMDFARSNEALIQTVSRLLKSFDGTDLEYAFRHGRMDAQQIHNLLAGRMPLDAESPHFRNTIYKRLAVLDPGAAEVLLTPYSVEDATHLKHEVISSLQFPYFDFLTKPPVEGQLSLLRGIPRSDNPAINGQLQNSWELAVQFYHDRYGNDFLEWVEQLPPGSARDQATASLLRRMDYADADEFNRLRGLIQDPTIREGFAPR